MMYVHLKGRNKSSLRSDDQCKWGRKLHRFDRHVSSCCLPSRYFCCWCVSPVWEDNSMQAHACSYNTQHFITDGIVSAPATPSNKLLITDHTDTHQLWDGENLIHQRFFHLRCQEGGLLPGGNVPQSIRNRLGRRGPSSDSKKILPSSRPRSSDQAQRPLRIRLRNHLGEMTS